MNPVTVEGLLVEKQAQSAQRPENNLDISIMIDENQ